MYIHVYMYVYVSVYIYVYVYIYIYIYIYIYVCVCSYVFGVKARVTPLFEFGFTLTPYPPGHVIRKLGVANVQLGGALLLALGSTLALVLQETSIANYFASQVTYLSMYVYRHTYMFIIMYLLIFFWYVHIHLWSPSDRRLRLFCKRRALQTMLLHRWYMYMYIRIYICICACLYKWECLFMCMCI